MDKAIIKEMMHEIISTDFCRTFIDIPDADYDALLAACISSADIDWLFDQDILNKILRYIISNSEAAALELASEIKAALANYYNVHLEILFDESLAEIETAI